MEQETSEVNEAEYFKRTADALEGTQRLIDRLQIHTSDGTVQALAFCEGLEEKETLTPATRLLLQGHGIIQQLESIREMMTSILKAGEKRGEAVVSEDLLIIRRAAERALKELGVRPSLMLS